MKKTFLIILVSGIFTSVSFGQYSAVMADHSFRYVATPGFVNVTELNGAFGLEDEESVNSKYYFGLTNIFGYQIDRNFFGGIGVGYLHYDEGNLFPVFLEYKYSIYLRQFSPYFYADGGSLMHPTNFFNESKIFINPGIGISRALSSKLEINLSVGYMIQARTTLTRVTFINFKLGVILRKNAFRMFRAEFL